MSRFFWAAMLLACLGLGWAVWDFEQPSSPMLPFDPVAWKAGESLLVSSNDPGCVRGGMGLDLIRHRVLQDQSAAITADMLGQPVHKSGREWVYELGQCSGWGWQHSELRVQFDDQGERVTGAAFRHAP